MSAKYYTHFIAQSEDAIEYNEYRGVVELLGRTGGVEGDLVAVGIKANAGLLGHFVDDVPRQHERV